MVDINLNQIYERIKDKMESSNYILVTEENQGVVPPPSNNDRRNNYSYLQNLAQEVKMEFW